MPRRLRPSARSTSPTDAVPRTFSDALPLPRVLVFDLDYTLWPFWIDTHVTPPIKPSNSNSSTPGTTAKDRYGDTLAFYPEVPAVLASAKQRGLLLAAASRTHTPDLAEKLLGILHVPDLDGEGGKSMKPAKALFDSRQIFPGNKVAHMGRIQKQLGVEYEDMLFFDDEERNRNVEREKGVCFCLVRDGVTVEEVDRGVERWRKMRGVEAKGALPVVDALGNEVGDETAFGVD